MLKFACYWLSILFFSLRHFEHVRNRDPKEADEMRGQLLQHLKNLNKVVNESMALLNYLPEIAEQFGLTGSVGGAILKPRVSIYFISC